MKTEKEKMLAGEYYDARDPELLSLYHAARKLLQIYNHLSSEDHTQKQATLGALLGHIGANVWIETPFYCDYGKFISIGANTFININCMFLDDNTIRIGQNCLIAPYVQIYTALHPLSAAERIVQPAHSAMATYRTRSQPVSIGDNVWIGGNVVILPGVQVGDNTTIGAGSVVTQDIPPGVLAFGNPCKVVKKIEP